MYIILTALYTPVLYFPGGYYLYVNYSSTQTVNNAALVVSSRVSVPPGSTTCLRLWYQMMGIDKDCCQLRVRVYTAHNNIVNVWSQNGNVRNAWKEANITLTETGPFQVW